MKKHLSLLALISTLTHAATFEYTADFNSAELNAIKNSFAKLNKVDPGMYFHQSSLKVKLEGFETMQILGSLSFMQDLRFKDFNEWSVPSEVQSKEVKAIEDLKLKFLDPMNTELESIMKDSNFLKLRVVDWNSFGYCQSLAIADLRSSEAIFLSECYDE